jgi:hypothetical protein
VKCVIAVHDMTDEKLLCSKYEVLLYKNGLKPALIRKSKTKTKSRKSNEETKADNALEYENDNLKRIINLMEVKNRVLEENCNLLKEKNFYFESKLKQIEMESDVSDKEGRLEKVNKRMVRENGVLFVEVPTTSAKYSNKILPKAILRCSTAGFGRGGK